MAIGRRRSLLQRPHHRARHHRRVDAVAQPPLPVRCTRALMRGPDRSDKQTHAQENRCPGDRLAGQTSGKSPLRRSKTIRQFDGFTICSVAARAKVDARPRTGLASRVRSQTGEYVRAGPEAGQRRLVTLSHRRHDLLPLKFVCLRNMPCRVDPGEPSIVAGRLPRPGRWSGSDEADRPSTIGRGCGALAAELPQRVLESLRPQFRLGPWLLPRSESMRRDVASGQRERCMVRPRRRRMNARTRSARAPGASLVQRALRGASWTDDRRAATRLTFC